MAIARGNAAGTTNGSASSHTQSLDSGVSAAGKYLIAIFGVTSASDLVTGVTYAGVAMSLLAKRASTNAGFDYEYVYGLAAPTNGTNNLVVSLSGSAACALQGVVYTGVKQSGQPDSSGNNTSAAATSFPISSTIVAANSWQIMFTQDDNGNAAAGSGTTKISSWAAGAGQQVWDSNGALTAGSHSLTATQGVNRKWDGILIALSPDVSITVTETITGTDTFIKSMSRTVSESSTMTEIRSKALTRILAEVSTAVDLTALFGRLITKVLTETMTMTDLTASIRQLWNNIAKPTSSYSNRAKPSSSYSNRAKPSTSWTPRPKP